MADDPHYRPQRSDRYYAPDRPSRSGSAPQDDPLAELARLIGQDEAFIAASRESARSRQREPQHEPERSDSAPNWLNRTAQRSTQESRGAGAYEPEKARQASGYYGDPVPESGHRSHQTAVRWDAPVQEDEGHYPGSQDRGRDTWQDRGYDSSHDEEPDPYRTAAQDGRYDGTPQDAGHDRNDPTSRIDPFESEEGRIDYAARDQGSSLRRHGRVLTIAAVAGLAVVGTAAAFGYRAWTSGGSQSGQPPLIKADAAPTKVVPAPAADGQQNKLIYDRIGEKIQSSTDKVVSREEQPVELRDMAHQSGPRQALPSPGAPGTVMIGAQPPASAVTATGSVGPGAGEPKKVRTITIRPDQVSTLPAPGETDRSVPTPNIGPAAVPPPPAARTPVAAPPAPAQNKPSRQPAAAPLALNPSGDDSAASNPRSAAAAQPAPYRTAALPNPAEAGNYVVQISSQRSEAEAQASFRALQAKYPSVLGNRQPLIRRADLGSKGTYYRAQVGPFSTSEDANQLCSDLKAAGGQCIVQRN